MKRFINKILIVVFLLCAVATVFIFAAHNVNAKEKETVMTDKQVEKWFHDHDKMEKKFKVLTSEVDAYAEKLESDENIKKAYEKYYNTYGKKIGNNTVEQFKKAETYVDVCNVLSKTIVDWIENGKNADHLDNGYQIGKVVLKIASYCLFGAAGGIVTESALAILDNVTSFGESSESEIEQLQNHLDEKFDEVDFHLDELQRDLSEVSKQIDSQTKEIVERLSNALEATYAKQEVSKFMTSRDGNFDYSLFKEYLYASANPQSDDYSQNAYYYKLLKVLSEDSSDELIKDAFDNLYKYINATDNRAEKTPTEKLYDYLLKDDYGSESIQYYFYEFLNANSGDLDFEVPAFEAFNFMYDLYETALMADFCIRYCNAYQVLNMKSYNGELRYYYGTGDNDYITYDDVVALENKINNREEALLEQILHDMTAFFRVGDSYSVETSNGDYRICLNNGAGTFGNVQKNDTIYLNKYVDRWCTLFGLDLQDFEYSFDSSNEHLVSSDGSYKVKLENGSMFVANVSYRGINLYSINFTVGNNSTFSGGSGTEDDPYIISDPDQFLLLFGIDGPKEDCYELAGNLNMAGITLSPIADELNKFNGSFDGNGYTIYNLIIDDDVSSGLFGYIGEDGIVSNLNLANCSFNANSSDNDKLYAGAIAGQNEGTINNCHLLNKLNGEVIGLCSIGAIRNTDKPNKSLYTYAGGIVGMNYGTVTYCSIDNSDVVSESYFDYQSNSDSKNKQFVYAGGIFGETCGGSVTNCYIGESVTLMAKGHSECKDGLSWRHPYIEVFSGGLGGEVAGTANIKDIYSLIPETNVKCATYRINNQWSGVSDEVNIKEHHNPLIASYKKSQNDEISTSNIDDVTLASDDINISVVYYNAQTKTFTDQVLDQVYSYGEQVFRDNNIFIEVNGEIELYETLGYYGFETKKTSFEEAGGIRGYSDVETTVKMLIYIDEYDTIKTIEIPIVIEKPKPEKLEVKTLPNKTEYDYTELGCDISLEGASIKIVYEDGYEEEVSANAVVGKLNANEASAEIVNVEFDDYGSVVSNRKQSVEVSCTYKGITYTTKFDVTISCAHNWTHETVDATCEHLGYTSHTCEKCGAIYKDNYSESRLPHEAVIYNYDSVEARSIEGYVGYKDSTCTAYGYTGDVYCTHCHKIVEKGSVIDLKNHTYDDIHCNGVEHVCLVCGHTEQHFFSTTECDDCVEAECIYCHYKHTYEANSRSAIENLPHITITNTYALPEGENVVVFVELHGNEGITSAYLSIKYPEELTLVSYSLGNVLNKPDIEQFREYNDHLNVQLSHRDAEQSKNGTLLKLVFNLPKGSVVGDEFIIEVAGQEITDARVRPIEFLTYNGIISVVEHLPGDVNGDGIVDLLDATLIAKHNVTDQSDRAAFINSMKAIYANFDISYGDVTLDNNLTGVDIVRIIRYYVGGYETQIWGNKFKVILNYNDFETGDSVITVDYNHGNGTYGDKLVEVELPGYRFDGWYTDRTYTTKVDEDSIVMINEDQLKQTLYAHYTQNVVAFDGNTNTSGTHLPINYSDYSQGVLDGDYLILDNETFAKISNILFKHLGEANREETFTRTHTFLGWATSRDGSVDNAILDNVKLNARGLIESIDLKNSGFDGLGQVTLYAIWSVESINDYNADSYTGYEFINWKDLDGITNWSGQGNYEITSSKTFEADWKAIVYSVIYHGNGGTKGNDGQTTSYNDGVKRSIESYISLSPNSFAKEGYTFIGWSKTEGSNTVDYQNIAPVNYIDTENDYVANLYAIWQANNYYIHLNGNEPSGFGTASGISGDITCTYDSNFTLPGTPSLSGWLFQGWYKDAACTQKVGDANQTITGVNLATSGTVNLYAKWKGCTYTINFVYTNPSSGSIIPVEKGESSVTVTVGGLYNFPAPTCQYFVFDGWTISGDKYGTNGSWNKVLGANGASFSATANWIKLYDLPSYTTYTFNSGSREILIDPKTDGDHFSTFSDELWPSFNATMLRAYGYTKITVTANIRIKEVEDGYQIIALWCNGSELASVEVEHSSGSTNTSWGYHQVSYTVQLNNLADNAAFGLSYSARGKDKDRWYVGDTVITFVVEK